MTAAALLQYSRRKMPQWLTESQTGITRAQNIL